MVKQVYKDSVTCPNLQAVRDSGRDDPYVWVQNRALGPRPAQVVSNAHSSWLKSI
jgi:hypothetical protein